MATKTVINCMEHSIAQPNQGISIIIDQHTDQFKTQQVYDASSKSNIIKIQHSNDQNSQERGKQQQPLQQRQQHQLLTTLTTTTPTTQTLTLNNRNNKSNKTLIDIKRNDDHKHDRREHDERNVIEAKNEHVLQINCSTTSNEISRKIKKMLENSANTAKLEYNGVLTERGNERHNEVQCNDEKFTLVHKTNVDGEEVLTKNKIQLNSTAVEEDVDEESGQTASQQQQQQTKQLQQVNNGNNGNSKNSKNRENGQNSAAKLKLKYHNDGERNYLVKRDDDNEKRHNDNDNDHDHNHTKNQDHNQLTNKEEDNDDNNNDDSCISGSSSSRCGIVGMAKREVIDFSHGKRSLNEENSNSLLTKADASTTTTSKTLLTINAHNKVATDFNFNLNNFENSEKTNHVVKIQIKPNSNNSLTEKQITVVKIENLQEFQNNNNSNNNNKTSGNTENKNETQTEKLNPQVNDDETMVQKPSINSAATVTVSNINANVNVNGNSNGNANCNSNGNSNGNGNADGNANDNLNISNTSGSQGACAGTTVTELNVSNPNYLYYMMSSGQFSPCDTLDSGTGSDLESNGQLQQSSPNLQIKKSSNSSASSTSSSSSSTITPLEMHLKTTKIRVANTSNSLEMQQRQCSFTDSEESEASSLSCDSLHSNEFIRQSSVSPIQLKTSTTPNGTKKLKSFLPDSLLREIKNLKFSSNDYEGENEDEDDVPTRKIESNDDNKTSLYEPLSNQDYIKSHEFMQSRKNLNNLNLPLSSSLKRSSLPSKTFVLNAEDGTFIDTKMNSMPRTYEADKYYNFHVNEHDNFRTFGQNGSSAGSTNDDSLSISDYDMKSIHDDVFAGYKDLRCGSNTSTIRSSKGTVRGVKNRVRNGIATFLQLQQPNIKNYKEKDSGKVVLYTTSMGIIRDTYAKCSNVKQILRTLLVKFEERDVFMSVEYQQEIKERMHSDVIKVPQLYVEGQHIGDADTVERLNESGELRQLLKPYKSISTTYTCQTCGGYRLLPCPSCNGSKKSVHRNHFTAEFVALKCMNCDEVGLVKCHNC